MHFDKYLFETRPAVLRRLGRFLADLVPRDTGGWPLRHSEPWPSALPSRWSWALPLVIVRPDSEPGSSHAIEGELYAQEEVTLIEDMVVTGDRGSHRPACCSFQP